MKINSLATTALLVLLSPEQILDVSSGSILQHIVELALPWFQLVGITLQSIKVVKELSNERKLKKSEEEEKSKKEET
jgi:hypothetical protein